MTLGHVALSAPINCLERSGTAGRHVHAAHVENRQGFAEESLLVPFMPLTVPDLLTRARFVGPNAMRSVQQQFGPASGTLREHRSAKTPTLIALGLPADL